MIYFSCAFVPPCGWRYVAVLCRRRDASLPGLVEDEHGWASLEARVSSLAGPVAVAGLAQGDVAVGVVLTKGCIEGGKLGDRLTTVQKSKSAQARFIFFLFSKEYVLIKLLLQVLTVLLASDYVLRPVARMGVLVVEQASYAELLGGGAVPARPVAGAGRLVAEDAVQPVAVLSADGRVCWGKEKGKSEYRVAKR